MNPWSKVDYSRFIWEASMVVEKLSEVVPPSGRVPGRGLLVLPILEARRRWNRGEIAKKGSRHGGFTSRGLYGRRGAARGPPGVQVAPWRGPTLGSAGRAPGALVGPLCPPPPLGDSRSFFYADFLLDFSRIFGALLIWGKPEIERLKKTGTGTGVH